MKRKYVHRLIEKKFNKNLSFEIYFFRDSNHNEIDIVVEFAEKTLLFEIKCAKTPRYEHIKTMERQSGLFKNPKGFLLSFIERPTNFTKNIKAVPWPDIYGLLNQI